MVWASVEPRRSATLQLIDEMTRAVDVIGCASFPVRNCRRSQTITPNGALMATVIVLAARLPYEEARIPHLVDLLHIA